MLLIPTSISIKIKMKYLLETFDKISIANLADFENRLDGQIVAIEYQNKNGITEFDTIELIVDKILILTAIREKNFKEKYKDYYIVYGKTAQEGAYQKLNYDFLSFENDFHEVVMEYLESGKTNLFLQFDRFIEENYTNLQIIPHILNSKLIATLKKNYLELFNGFNFFQESYPIDYLSGSRTYPQLFTVLYQTLDFIENLIEELKTKFKFYYDEKFFETDLDLYFKKELENFNKQHDNSNSKIVNGESKENLYWFKVGLKFANGDISRLYEKEKTFIKVAKNISQTKWTSYRPYISESWNNTNTNDKNIFSDHKKCETIITYCKNNDIEISPSFYERYPK